jgi:hypothetical protein
MRAYLTTIILSLTLVVGELHKIWEHDTRIQNWIISEYYPMLIKWNMKYLEIQIVVIMYFLSWLVYTPNHVNKTTVQAFFCLAIMDTFLYFYNYKTHGFGVVYYWYLGFWLLSFYGPRLARWLWKHLDLKQ